MEEMEKRLTKWLSGSETANQAQNNHKKVLQEHFRTDGYATHRAIYTPSKDLEHIKTKRICETE